MKLEMYAQGDYSDSAGNLEKSGNFKEVKRKRKSDKSQGIHAGQVRAIHSSAVTGTERKLQFLPENLHHICPRF